MLCGGCSEGYTRSKDTCVECPDPQAAMASLRRFLSPAFYQAAATDFGAMVRTKYIQGNILAQPITGIMVTIGAVGYVIEYSVLGRYHVAHKKEKTAAAIKEYDAKHAHH